MFIKNIDKPDKTFIVKKLLLLLKSRQVLSTMYYTITNKKNLTFGFAFHWVSILILKMVYKTMCYS